MKVSRQVHFPAGTSEETKKKILAERGIKSDPLPRKKAAKKKAAKKKAKPKPEPPKKSKDEPIAKFEDYPWLHDDSVNTDEEPAAADPGEVQKAETGEGMKEIFPGFRTDEKGNSEIVG